MGSKKGSSFDWKSLMNSWVYVGCAWVLACVLQIVAVATPFWGKATYQDESDDKQYTEGLWQHCLAGNCTKNLLTRDDPGNPGFQVQSLELPGLVLIVAMACHWWMAMTREIRSQIQDWIFAVLAILGDCFILAGIAIYGQKDVFLGIPPEGVESISLHASFIIACIVLIICILSTVAGIYLTYQYHITRRPPWKYHP